MIEQRWLFKKGRIAGDTTHYYIPPDDSGLWLFHPQGGGYFVKLQYRYKKEADFPYAPLIWSDWIDVSVAEE